MIQILNFRSRLTLLTIFSFICISWNPVHSQEESKPFHILTGHTDKVSEVVFSNDGKILISGSDDRIINIWDISTGKLLHQLIGHPDYISDLAISADGKILVSSSGDADYTAKEYGNIKVWDLHNQFLPLGINE